MPDDPGDVTQVIILAVLIALSAFFSSSETALTAVNKIRLRSLVEEGAKGAKTTYKLLEDPTKMLGAILIGNNVVNLSAASLATTLAIDVCTEMGIGQNASIGIGIANGVITILILIFGEIAPKSLATLYAEQISLKVGGIIYYLGKILTPVIFIVNKLALGVLALLRIDTTSKVSAITESELRTLVDVSHEEGVIESEERKMITNVVDFGDSLAKDVMVPHIDMEFVNVEASYDELVEAFEEEKYSRLPVYDETKDDVIGVINLKDVFFYKDKPENFHIREHMREPYFTYEFQKTSEILMELRKASAGVAIVLDEYGATAGLITLEDLLEEIVGEIRDEYDDDEVDPIQMVGEDEFIAEGSTRLEDINEVLGLSLDSDDYDSIAGHIINLLEHLPKKGESVQEGNILYTVSEMDKNRIDKVRIKRFPIERKEDSED